MNDRQTTVLVSYLAELEAKARERDDFRAALDLAEAGLAGAEAAFKTYADEYNSAGAKAVCDWAVVNNGWLAAGKARAAIKNCEAK